MALPRLTVGVAFDADPLDEITDDAYLSLPGSAGAYASTPDSAGLDVVGDLELVARVRLTDYTPAAENYIVGKYGTTANQRSYAMSVNTTGTIQYRHSANGIAGTTVASTVTLGAAGIVDNTTYWLKVTHDVDNGAAGTSVRFYWAADAVTEPSVWTQLGATVTTAGVVTLFPGTARLNVGSINDGSFTPSTGRVYRVIVRSGIGGSSVFDMPFNSTIAYSGQTSLVESVAAAVVTVNGTASTVASSGWTEVSSDLLQDQSLGIDRGRATELDTFQAGRLSCTLDNDGAEYSPLNASSPYVGKLLPNKQIRVTATHTSVTYPMFRGFVTGWPQRYDEGKVHAIVPLEAYDALSLFAGLELGDPVLDYMTDTIGGLGQLYRNYDAKVWTDVVGGRNAQLRRGVTISRGSALADALVGTGVNCNACRFKNAPYDGGTPLLSSAGAISFWVQTTSAGTGGEYMVILNSSAGLTYSQDFMVGIDSTGAVVFTGHDFVPASLPSATTTAAVNDGDPHHIMIVFTPDGVTANTIYIDGVPASTGNANYVQPGAGQFIGRYDGATTNTDFSGTVEDIAYFYGVTPTAAQVARLYAIATSTYVRSTADQLTAVLDEVGWPATMRDIATNTYGECSHTWVVGDSALAEMQAIAATEQGRLFIDASGRVVLRSRYSHELDTVGTTVQATMSDDGSDMDYMDLGFDYDDLNVKNDVRISSTTGVKGASEDATSIDRYFRRTMSVATQLPTAAEAQDMADGLVYWRKDVQVRSKPLTTHPDIDPALWPTILGLEIGDRVRFEITPPGMGSQSQQSQMLEQLGWDLVGDDWVLVVQGSPVPAAVGVYDEDTYDGGAVYGF